MKSSTKPEIEVVYEEPIELLDESVHHDSATVNRKLNEALKEINHLKRNR